jgi:hypothetical protein
MMVGICMRLKKKEKKPNWKGYQDRPEKLQK